MTLAAGALSFAANLVLVPRLGLLGAALTTAVSYVLLAGACLHVGRRYLTVAWPLGFLGRATVAAALMGGALALVRPPPHLLALTIVALAAAALYGLLLYLLGGISSEERQQLRKLLSPRVRAQGPTR
jgi:O-antigen/teichoic acid export membrane protein